MRKSGLVRPAGRKGFSLLEMAVVIAGLGLVMAIMAAALLGTIRVERTDAAALHRTLLHASLADQFRQDVAGAAATPEKWDRFEKSPSCLILKRPDQSHIVYRWNSKNLERIHIKDKKDLLQIFPLEDEDLKVEFAADKAEPRLITLRLALEQKAKKLPERLLAEIAALVGGDLR